MEYPFEASLIDIALPILLAPPVTNTVPRLMASGWDAILLVLVTMDIKTIDDNG
jgi:hypothetical protein